MRKPILFIDDDEIERRSCVDVLKEVFQDTSVEVVAQAPLPSLASYAQLVADDDVAAFILDEKLNTSGIVNYTGAELAEHLREIGGHLPIVIFTNYAEDICPPKEWAVESIVSKKAVVQNPQSPTARALKARLCRQIEFVSAVHSEAGQRYHALLVKSATGSLSNDEDTELRNLESERIAPVAAAEREKQRKLDAEIETLKRLLSDERMF